MAVEEQDVGTAGPVSAPPAEPRARSRRVVFLVVLVAVALAAAAAAAWALLGREQSDSGPPQLSAQDLREMDSVLRDAQRGEERFTGALLEDPLHASPDPSSAFTEDAVWEDWGVRRVGSDAVARLIRNWALFSPQAADRDRYVGRASGVVTDVTWNMLGWTKERPGGGIYELGIRDGRFASTRTLLELGVVTPETARAMGTGLDPELVPGIRSLHAAYAGAWSAGDPSAVAVLYTPAAVREDRVLGSRQEGGTEIGRFASRLQEWYPSARFTAVRSYTVGAPSVPGRTDSGLELTIGVRTEAGKPCDVKAAVMLASKNGKITSERVYYDADSLVACGWAR